MEGRVLECWMEVGVCEGGSDKMDWVSTSDTGLSIHG